MKFEDWRDEMQAFQDGFVAWKRKHHVDTTITFSLVQQYRLDNYDPQNPFYNTLVDALWDKIQLRANQ